MKCSFFSSMRWLIPLIDQLELVLGDLLDKGRVYRPAENPAELPLCAVLRGHSHPREPPGINLCRIRTSTSLNEKAIRCQTQE